METKKTLPELVEGALNELYRLQYSPLSIKQYKQKFNQFMKFVKDSGTEDIYSEELASRFLKERYDYPSEQYKEVLPTKIHAALRSFWLLGEYQLYGRFHRKFGKKGEGYWSSQDMEIIESYANAVQTSDNSRATKKLRISHIKAFYAFLNSRSIKSIQDVTPQIISEYTISLGGGSPVYAKHRLATLKFFLRYLYNNGFCADLSYAVPRVKNAINFKLPAFWAEEEISKLLKSIDRGNPVGKRNYAILLLVIRLGIRSSDIVSLKLENLKWDRKEITFSQHKTGKHTAYPMSDEIGWAIIDYIRYGRPKTELNYLFIFSKAPYSKLNGHSIAYILSRQLIRADIQKKPGVVWGPHSLRHTLAKQLLLHDIPLPLLSQIMGHSSVISASPYLKMDIDKLRECALTLNNENDEK